MSESEKDKLVISISSRALFDLSASHEIFEREGVEAYRAYQIANENNHLEPGFAFNTINKLLALRDQQGERLVEVILLSRNSADTGLRIFNSIQHHGLNISRAAFTSGETPYSYNEAFGAHLFLSTHTEDVKLALESGMAAATIWGGPNVGAGFDSGPLKIAFDGDAVIFSDESERIYQNESLAGFVDNEVKTAKVPMGGGPFKGFLHMLQRLQSSFAEGETPIRTALVTARCAPAHERVIRTLRAWDIRIDEAIFLGGMAKGEFLRAFGADLFFDDQRGHCESAKAHVTTAHVPHGVTNE